MGSSTGSWTGSWGGVTGWSDAVMGGALGSSDAVVGLDGGVCDGDVVSDGVAVGSIVGVTAGAVVGSVVGVVSDAQKASTDVDPAARVNAAKPGPVVASCCCRQSAHRSETARTGSVIDVVDVERSLR